MQKSGLRPVTAYSDITQPGLPGSHAKKGISHITCLQLGPSWQESHLSLVSCSSPRADHPLQVLLGVKP